MYLYVQMKAISIIEHYQYYRPLVVTDLNPFLGPITTSIPYRCYKAPLTKITFSPFSLFGAEME